MEIDQIYLGDANELIKRVPDKSIDLVVTDPPYEIKSMTKDKTSGIFKDRGMAKYVNEVMGFVSGVDLSILPELERVMKKINIYIWCNKEQIYDYMTYFVKEKGCNFEIIVWAKTNPLPFTCGHYLKDKEYCLFFWEKGVELSGSFKTMGTVYQTSINMDDKNKYDHPTIKPLDIIENFVSNSSKEGDLVLDPFIGSGTTAVASKALGRHYIGFEINPGFHQIALDRLAGVTQRDKETEYVQNKLF